MITLRLVDAAVEICERLRRMCPEIPSPPRVKLQMLDYQLAALYYLAQQYDHHGARILEIGTGQGGSAYMLSMAAPKARIVTLTTSQAERDIATKAWAAAGRTNVECRVIPSWHFLAARESGGQWDMVYCDGDHNQIAKDLPWFNRLPAGGLMVFHDYSPAGSRSASPIVFDTLNRTERRLCRAFDVLLMDAEQIGMAGFYRLHGESLP